VYSYCPKTRFTIPSHHVNFSIFSNIDPRPVQRVPRYELLLNELKKNTWETHPDFDSISEGLTNVQIIAKSINESKKKAENMNKIISIQEALEGYKVFISCTFYNFQNLVQPSRSFIKEGVLAKEVDSDYVDLSSYVFLFNDALLITKRRKVPFSLSFYNCRIFG
jgi:hypothetical protein